MGAAAVHLLDNADQDSNLLHPSPYLVRPNTDTLSLAYTERGNQQIDDVALPSMATGTVLEDHDDEYGPSPVFIGGAVLFAAELVLLAMLKYCQCAAILSAD